jgi:hypothetical protein
MYAKLTLKNVNATSFLIGELVDICFWIPLQRKQSRKTKKVMILRYIIFLMEKLKIFVIKIPASSY